MKRLLNSPCKRGAVLIALFAVGVRWLLATRGGQDYWPDEARYARAKHAVRMLIEGNLQDAARIFDSADHLFFKALSVLPASIEIGTVDSNRIPAIFFSTFFALTLFVLWGIVRRTGAGEGTALVSVALLAGCNSFFIYSRHLVPYDAAMAIGLCAVYVGMRPDPRPWTSVICGFWAGVAFLTYTGYWTLTAFAVLTHTFYQDRKPARVVFRMAVSAAAAVLPTIFLCGLSWIMGGGLAESFVAYGSLATQGDFREGWSLPFEYLWHTEHLNLVIWIAAALFAIFVLRRMRHPKTALFALAGLLFFYGTMTLFSTGLHKFVVYGRLARQLAPFFCILTSAVLVHTWGRWPKARFPLLLAAGLMTVQSAYDLYQPFRLTFPIEFRQALGAAQREFPKGRYDLLNAGHIYPHPVLSSVKYQRAVYSRPHPLEYPPYQYEGFTPEQRRTLRSTDISMRLMLRE